MNVTTNSALVWKRVADEHQHSVKILARVSAGLIVLLLATGAYAFATKMQYRELCGTIETKTDMAKAPPVREFGRSLSSGHCG